MVHVHPQQPAFVSGSPLVLKPTKSSFLESFPKRVFNPSSASFFPASRPQPVSMTSAVAQASSGAPPASPTTNTFICTSLTAPTLLKQLAQARQAANAGADLIEIRVDLLDPNEQPGWHRLLPALPLPAIVTNRAAWEGGAATAPEPDRLAVLLDAVRRNVSHIDVELKAIPAFIELCQENQIPFPLTSTKLILSHHDFENPIPDDRIAQLITSMTDAGAHVCKIAMMATSAIDNISVFRALTRAQGNVVVLAMGELGMVSRIAAGKFGSYLTFASAEAGAESAPGQVDVETLVNFYRFRSTTAETPLYGVIGDPIKQSMSPALHNAALRHSSLDAMYVPLRVEGNYAAFVREILSFGFRGLSVTAPGKVDVMDAMDEVDSVASQIGAMNTVVKSEDGSVRGYNTDWLAAISAIEEKFADGLTGKRVVCIGAGGAGRALAFGALARGAAHVVVVNRSVEKAEELAKDLGIQASAMSQEAFNRSEESTVEYDVLMNSTSVGMYPKSDGTSPVEADRLLPAAVVFDAVYNPLETRLLKEAKERGCTTVSGLEMFVRQAAEQFRLWFPAVEAPVSLMREVTIDTLNKRKQ